MRTTTPTPTPRSYKFKVPGLDGHCGPIPGREFTSAKECRAFLRRFLWLTHMPKLPRGYRVWPVRSAK